MSWPETNGVATVYLSLNQTACERVGQGSEQQPDRLRYAHCYRMLGGRFDIFRPNLITPNGDGYNDNWIVTDAAGNYSPINAFRYSVDIRNSGNTQVFLASATVSSGHLGIIGGDILWNGRVNGSGSIARRY